MQQPHHSLALLVTIPAPFTGSNRESLHRSGGKQHPRSENSRYCNGCAKHRAECSLTASLPPRISPLSEHPGRGGISTVNVRQKPRAQSALCLHSLRKVTRATSSCASRHHQSSSPTQGSIDRASGASAAPSAHASLHFTCSCLPKAQTNPFWKPGVRPGGVCARGPGQNWGGLSGDDHDTTCRHVCFTVQVLLSSLA